MKLFRHLILGLTLALMLPVAFAQRQSVPQQQSSGNSVALQQNPDSGQSVAESPKVPPQESGVREELAQTSREAAGEHEENAKFKESPAVQFVARITGLRVQSAYWTLVVINFLIIGVLIAWALKKNLPSLFRTRTDMIRRSMDEARRASEEAKQRMTDIENRLSRLDAEIAEMRKKAEDDAAAEEQRIRTSAEEEGRKIVASAEQDIEAAVKAAQRDLKAYAANLSVSLAEKRIKVDADVDRALVNTFVRQLGRDGNR